MSSKFGQYIFDNHYNGLRRLLRERLIKLRECRPGRSECGERSDTPTVSEAQRTKS